MKDQALIKNKYVDFFYEQVDIQRKVSVNSREFYAERYTPDLFGIEIIKGFQGLIINQGLETDKGLLITIGNFNAAKWKGEHAGIYTTANEIINFESELSNLSYERGISFLVGKDSKNNDKLVAFLDKPSLAGDWFDSQENIFSQCHKQVFKNWGVDAVYILKTDKEIEASETIYPNTASQIIDLYTYEAIK